MLLLVIALGSLGASVYLIGEVITLPVRERVGSMQRASPSRLSSAPPTGCTCH